MRASGVLLSVVGVVAPGQWLMLLLTLVVLIIWRVVSLFERDIEDKGGVIDWRTAASRARTARLADRLTRKRLRREARSR